MKKLILLVFILALMNVMNLCSASKIDWDNNTITAEGTGIAPDYATTVGQGQALAKRAAIVDAYRNLATIIYGIQVDSDTTIEQLAVKKDTIKTSVSGLIRNARIVDEELLPNGNYQITMAVKTFGEQNSVAAAVWNDKEPAVNTPAPYVKDTLAEGSITGIVIDCRGLGLERAMAPNILDNTGRKIYSPKYVDSKYIIENGLASYSTSRDPSELTRAGSNPIIIKAMSLDQFNSYPVISKEDGDKILSANQLNNFLRSCPVVFIQ